MYVKKFTSFCQALKKMHTKENWFLFSALRSRRDTGSIAWLQTLEISGKIKPLVGQNAPGKSAAPLALFALCCPFGPLPLPDVPWRDYTFKTKHAMDLTLLSMDARCVLSPARHFDRFALLHSPTSSNNCLQCFDAVGWAAGRAPGL